MRTYEEKTVQKTERILTSLRCDICGQEAKRLGVDCFTWELDYRDYDITVQSRILYRYDHDSEIEHDFDICPECFQNKLVPFIRSQSKERA